MRDTPIQAKHHGHFTRKTGTPSWGSGHYLAAWALVGVVLLLLTGCVPHKDEKRQPALPKTDAPSVPAVPGPGAPGARPVDPADALTPVECREIIVPEKRLPGLLRPVSIDSRGRSLSSAVRKWSNDCGVSIALHPELLRGKSPRSYPVWLKVDGIRAKDALEWLCRVCHVWYVILDQCIYLVPDYRWLANEEATFRVDLVGGLYDARGEDLMHFLSSCLAVYLNNNRHCRISLHPESGRLTTVLPPEAYDVVRRVIREVETHAPFRAHRDQLPSSIVLPAADEPPTPALTDQALRDRLARTIQTFYREADVQDILADIADRTGINMAFDYRSIPESRRRLTLNLGYVTAGALLQEVIQCCCLQQMVTEPQRGLWITSQKDVSEPLRPRHQAWQRVVFRSYPARDLVETKSKTEQPEAKAEKERSSPEKLLNHVIETVGGDWREPAYAIGYNQPSGRLLLQHEAEVHARIPAILSAYRRSVKILGEPVPLLPPGAPSQPENKP